MEIFGQASNIICKSNFLHLLQPSPAAIVFPGFFLLLFLPVPHTPAKFASYIFLHQEFLYMPISAALVWPLFLPLFFLFLQYAENLLLAYK